MNESMTSPSQLGRGRLGVLALVENRCMRKKTLNYLTQADGTFFSDGHTHLTSRQSSCMYVSKWILLALSFPLFFFILSFYEHENLVFGYVI